MGEHKVNPIVVWCAGKPVNGPEQHLKPTCPHCGRQDCTGTMVTLPVRCNPFTEQCGMFDHGRHASDREDYLTDECARLENVVATWKDRDATVNADYRVEKRRVRKWKKRAGRIHGYAIQVETERDEARADVQIEADEANRLRLRLLQEGVELEHVRSESRQWLRHYNEAQEANEPLRKELDAIRTRARGMREALGLCEERAHAIAKWVTESMRGPVLELQAFAAVAAGEPIP
jgi:hypothetical protein